MFRTHTQKRRVQLCIWHAIVALLLLPACTHDVAVAPIVRRPAALVTASNTVAPAHLPILAYHRVMSGLDNHMNVSPALFRQHMQYLHTNHYKAISLDEWHMAVCCGTPLPEKIVVITFDDAWRDQYEQAAPILEEFGMHATFFAYTSVIGTPNYMSWTQLRDLAQRGHAIGCHSATHCDLARPFAHEDAAAYARRLTREIDEVQRLTSDCVAAPVQHYCYPYGYYNTDVVAHVRAAPYATAVTVNPMINTRATPLHQLGRFIIAPWTKVADLEALLTMQALPVLASAPRDGAILSGTLTNIVVWVPPGTALPLARVRMKWNWRWTDSAYDPVRGVIVCAVPVPLKPNLYTAQVHAWDAHSNHYAYAWLFQQCADAGLPRPAAAATVPAPRRTLVLFASPGR
jgi:peptidoglycan/xylan/chitin deacetylase (PgdA/CDA1 family)